MYQKLISNSKPKGKTLSHKLENRNLLAADTSPMKVIASIETEVKLNGLIVPFSFSVIDKLGYDCILGMDFLEDTKAVIDVRTNTLSLFDGLTTIPMTKRGNITTIQTVANFSIPAFSEAALAVKTRQNLPAGTYMIEGGIHSPCRALLVARTLVDTVMPTMFCRVMNATDRPIRLRAGTTIGELSPVTINTVNEAELSEKPPVFESLPSTAEMRRILEEKSITFQDTALKGQDLDDLIAMLYKNMDIMATSLKDLPGCGVLRYRIDTGNNSPVRQRAIHRPIKLKFRVKLGRCLRQVLLKSRTLPGLAL